MERLAKYLLLICVVVGGYKAYGYWNDQKISVRTQGSGDEVIMYALTTCAFCKAKAKEFKAHNIQYTEYHIDVEPGMQRELEEKLKHAGIPVGAIGTPIIEVNGVLLPNNPSLMEIKRHFKQM